MTKVIQKILVVGGGSAGYLSALVLKTKLPELDIKVVQTEQLPIIGVGEGTTAILPGFLKDYLGLDQDELYRRVKPTWKLGIKFEWGLPNKSFNYTFANTFDTKINLLKKNNAYYYLNDLGPGSVPDCLMNCNKSPLGRLKSGQLHLDHSIFGFHLENRAFVSYLKSKILDLGVEIHDKKITKINKNSVGEISSLDLEDETSLKADLYIDCSGFNSILLGETLKEKYIDFRSSLFCDTAITGSWLRQEGEAILPYTTSETMNNGWCWRVELKDRVNRGYVFSSQFSSVEKALEEMKEKNPQMADDHRVIKFTTGRYQSFWVKNVAAIGNASGFVEPLEATGLHMICETSRRLVEALIDSNLQPSESIKLSTSEIIGELWDDIRWFLSLHYKFNKYLNTPFWKYCREQTDISGVQKIVDFYYENGPSPMVFHSLPRHSMFNYDGYIAMLVSLKAPCKFKNHLEEKDIDNFKRLSDRFLRHSEASFLDMSNALGLLEKSKFSFETP
ncbi:MAG: tryptophan 7-halogenase [Candidatus Caenarcaniphilales bacterium]|nr:tryptophan 7-halogenase [Candidatus Caenarcaniphilales bacterium]